MLRLFKVEPKDEATSTYTLDEVAAIVEQSTREGVLSDTTGALTNAFEFTAKKVHDVEVPMAQIVALPCDLDTRTRCSWRWPSTASPATSCSTPTASRAGYVHLKDVMDLSTGEAASEPFPAKRIRRLTAVLRDADLEDGLASMRRSGSHVARVGRPARAG